MEPNRPHTRLYSEKQLVNNDASDDKMSVTSRRSHCSRASSVSRGSSSSARRDALVEAAAAKKAFEYEQLLVSTMKQHEQELAEQARQLEEEERQRAVERAETERQLEAEELQRSVQKAESERQLAAEERQRSARKAESERLLAQKKADSERELSLLAASKAAAIAEAKLVAIDQVIQEENDSLSRADSSSHVSIRRTKEWVQSQDGSVQNDITTNRHVPHVALSTNGSHTMSTRAHVPASSGHECQTAKSHAQYVVSSPREYYNAKLPVSIPINIHNSSPTTSRSTDNTSITHTSAPISADDLQQSEPFDDCGQNHDAVDSQRIKAAVAIPLQKQNQAHESPHECKTTTGFAGNTPAFIPHSSPVYAYDQTAAFVSRQLSASLARQNLPKFEPDVFDGDVTLFHPWKSSFKIMVSDAEVSPAHELTLLKKFTKGEAQKTVDSFRRRLYKNPKDAVRDVWIELDSRFGNSAAVAQAYLDILDKAAKFGENDKGKLQDFAIICSDVKSQVQFLPGLASLNFSNVLQPVVLKLPKFLRTKWEKIVVDHAESNDNAYPEFGKFADLIVNQSKLKNHPNLQINKSSKTTNDITHDSVDTPHTYSHEHDYRVFKSDTDPRGPVDYATFCVVHQIGGHNLMDCTVFQKKHFQEKCDIVKKAGICRRCLTSKHAISDCTVKFKCHVCDSNGHRTAFHDTKPTPPRATNRNSVQTLCTAVCNDYVGGYSCSKVVLVDIYPAHNPERAQRIYAIVDEQSNATMITPELIDTLGLDGSEEMYLLSTCSGEKETKYGRRIPDLVLRSMSGEEAMLPTCIECEAIPADKNEIASPSIAREYPHLRRIADEIPEIDDDAHVSILIGRNAPELLKVRSFINGPSGAPWAHKLLLGWTISGQACLDRTSGAVHVVTRKTTASNNNGKKDDVVYDIVPCPNHVNVNNGNIFAENQGDNEIGISQDDVRFIQIMDNSYHKNQENKCEMPLPFRGNNISMPRNRSQAMKRLNSLQRTFQRKPNVKDDYVAFMKDMFDRNHASVITRDNTTAQNDESGQMWYLPHFGVYHPKKPTQIRVVFDSSAEYDGVSLNKVPLTGPDQLNSLIGVLFRFRRENVALMCDIEKMFHSFSVNEEHRDFLRFLWFKDHNPDGDVVDCRMNVHLFGNASSPAIATYGLRRTADEGRETYGTPACDFVNKNFYVDDGITSCATECEAIELIKKTQGMLKESCLRLHKVASNSAFVMSTLPEDDRAKGIRELDLEHDTLPAVRSLGVTWNMDSDTLTFKVNLVDKPFTRRGVLSIVNSVYDPLGIAAPVTIKGKIILQRANVINNKPESSLGWDDALPDEMLTGWKQWKEELVDLENVSVPRCYHPEKFGDVTKTEIHAFSDASQDAIGTVLYIRQVNATGDVSVCFVYGQAKVAPVRLTTIPRLELCVAVLSTEATKKFAREIQLPIDDIYYYTDSKIVLGYVQNDSRRFHVYVANRVQRIRNVSNPCQWRYIDTSQNPADIASRGIHAKKLMDSSWIKGPRFLKQADLATTQTENISLAHDDPDVRKVVTVHRTNVETIAQELNSARFLRFSTWASVLRAVANLIMLAKRIKNTGVTCRTISAATHPVAKPTQTELKQAERIVIRAVQHEEFEPEINALRDTSGAASVNIAKVLKSSPLHKLDPFLDEDDILRVGGRLRRSELTFDEKHPIILPKNHHVSRLIIEHYHTRVHHQGRTITHGAVRNAGVWIIGGQSKVSQTISSCVTCRRLRGKLATQKMADLPSDRSECSPPFTNVGFDVFGPWTITTKKLRGGSVETKRWALLLTCLASRAIHIEVLESMDSSSFISALRRFFAVRGPAALVRCDRGTNFVGGKGELDDALQEMKTCEIEKFVTEYGCQWIFNPPHSSHFGGVWERQIGTVRRILDAMFLELGHGQLTNEVLVTFMAEITGIVNARPISAISCDSDEPMPLSPAMLLTQKTRPYTPVPGNFVRQDLYVRRRWRRVQYLADQFWVRWRREYLQNLQQREKWQTPERNLHVDDIVIVKDVSLPRYMWPLGIVSSTYESEDGKVRKVDVRICKDGSTKVYTRPTTDFVLLMEC